MSKIASLLTMATGFALVLAMGGAFAAGHHSIAEGASASTPARAAQEQMSPTELRQRCPICNSHCC